MVLCFLAELSFAGSITATAQKSKVVYAAGREKTLLIGDAQIVTSDFVIKSEQIEMYGSKQRYIETKTPVFIHDSKRNIDIRGDSLFYDRETDILKISGNAQLEDFKNEMLVRGGILESRNKDNIAIIQVGVRVFKKEISARSEMLLYRRDDDMVELSGLPVVYKKNDEYRASIITINIKTEEIQMTGKVQGTVQTQNSPKPIVNATSTSITGPSPISSPVPIASPSSSTKPGLINGQ